MGCGAKSSLRSVGLALCQRAAVHEEVNHFLPEKETGKDDRWGLRRSQPGIALFPKMGIPSRPRINGTVGAKKK